MSEQKTNTAASNPMVINIPEALEALQANTEKRVITVYPIKNEQNNYLNVPDELKQHKSWVCWSLENRNGNWAKVPKNPKTGGNASATLSGTWGTFEDAESYYAGHLNIDGIGYVFTTNVIGIDFDHCVEDGKIISDEIRELVDRCKSYVEISPSETGLHMYVKGKWKEPGGRKNNKLGNGMAIEVYPSARFFTVTGNTFGEVRPLAEDQELLDEIYDRYFSEEQSGTLLPISFASLDVNPEYVKRLQDKLKSNHWMALLWQGHHTKESESEADMALICRLLKICDGDEDSVKKLFLASPFAMNKDCEHRKKLKRDDYWRTSIDNAMDYLELHPEFDRNDQFRSLLRYDGDNDGRVSMLFEYMDGNVRYCKEQKTWLVYRNGCWVNDEVDQELKVNAVNLYQGLKSTVKEIVSNLNVDDEERKKANDRLMKKIGSFGSSIGVNNVIKYAQSYKDFIISEKQLDTHDDLLEAGNGIINLRTGELLPFDRQYYITRRTEINYNPDAPEPKEFLKFMHDTSCDIQEWIDYMQLVLGYCITGCTNQEAFFVFHGETGQNGKSTLLDLLCNMFPQHITTMNKVALSESKNNTELNSPLAQIKNYRMVITDENEGKRQLDEALVRGIASGASPKVRDLFEKSKSDNSNFVHYKLIFCGNFVPKFNWRLNANMRRLCLIPFNNTIPNGKEDTHLKDRLSKEREGILAWIVKGAMRSFKESVKNRPPVVVEYTEALMYQEDPIYAFTQEEIIMTDNPEDTIQATELFDHYNDWREIHDLPRVSYKDAISGFGQRLKQLGYQKRFNSKKQVIYFGIKLRQEDHSDDKNEVSDSQVQ